MDAFGFKDRTSGKIDETQIKAYVLEEKLDMEYAPRKIRMPKDYKEFPQFQVKAHHLDTNHHVNNGHDTYGTGIYSGRF